MTLLQGYYLEDAIFPFKKVKHKLSERLTIPHFVFLAVILMVFLQIAAYFRLDNASLNSSERRLFGSTFHGLSLTGQGVSQGPF